MQKNIRTLCQSLASGEVTAEQIASECLDKSRDATGVFISINTQLVEQARQVDAARARGDTLPDFAGVPITLKDLFGVRGEQNLAGSVVLRDTAPIESEDAEVIAHLRTAGILFAGRANMSEFAFSGMGLNPHFPLLTSVWDRENQRLPGGSSSGSAVSVALGIVAGTLGSDTAGSCRLPAAFNGVVGVKPTFGRLSLKGVYPLSPTSDAPGPLGMDVDSCFLLDHIMSGACNGSLPPLQAAAVDTLRILIPEGRATADLDPEIAEAFEGAIARLETAGATILRQPMAAVDGCIDMFLARPIVPYEAWRHHRVMIESRGELYDPFVRERARGGSKVSDQEQENRYREKSELIQLFNQQFSQANVDVVAYPAAPCVPPLVSDTFDPERITPVNVRCLRNTAAANYYDGCAITLPCHPHGHAPAGLMLSSTGGSDRRLYQIAAGVEAVLQD